MDFTMAVFDRVELHPLAQQPNQARAPEPKRETTPKNIKESVFKTWIEPWKARRCRTHALSYLILCVFNSCVEHLPLRDSNAVSCTSDCRSSPRRWQRPRFWCVRACTLLHCMQKYLADLVPVSDSRPPPHVNSTT